jgi:SAM-dependent methyltransferase
VTSNHQVGFNRGVRAYYEQNGAWFRLVGRRQRSRSIHRPVWAEGIRDRQSALNHVNECISRQLQEVMARRPSERVHLLDLGCGFGGTIQYLVRQFGRKIWAVGLTVSAQQARVAQQWVNKMGVADCCTFLEADFHALPLAGGVDVAFSVEAFAHASEPERYFAEAARLLKPGGRLILCDDFRSDDQPSDRMSAEAQRWLQIFKRGWHVPHLLSPHQVSALAQQYQLCEIAEIDFNPYLRMRAFPAALIPLFEWAIDRQGKLSPLFESVIGGWALEQLIRSGNVTYRFLVFEKGK